MPSEKAFSTEKCHLGQFEGLLNFLLKMLNLWEYMGALNV